jgi:N utilization substance protein B
MQLIFEKVSGGQGGEESLKMVYDELRTGGIPGGKQVFSREPDEEDRAYITKVFDGVMDHLEEIDNVITKTAKGWSLERMSLVDLTILRVAVWEILYDPETPVSVSVSEALELTEFYSDPDDKPFINGILGTVIREHEAGK